MRNAFVPGLLHYSCLSLIYVIICNTVGFLHAFRCALTLISGEAFEALSVC